MTIPIFVISLPNSERRVHIKTHLEEHHLPFEFWDGHIVTERIDAHGKNSLSFGTLGCLIAYLDLYKHIAENEIELTLILEDDVVCHPHTNFTEIIFSKVIDYTQADYCFLHSYPPNYKPCGTQSQLITLNAAKILNAERDVILNTNLPIDLVLWGGHTPLRIGNIYNEGRWLFKHAHNYDDSNLSERMKINKTHQNTTGDYS